MLHTDVWFYCLQALRQSFVAVPHSFHLLDAFTETQDIE